MSTIVKPLGKDVGGFRMKRNVIDGVSGAASAAAQRHCRHMAEAIFSIIYVYIYYIYDRAMDRAMHVSENRYGTCEVRPVISGPGRSPARPEMAISRDAMMFQSSDVTCSDTAKAVIFNCRVQIIKSVATPIGYRPNGGAVRYCTWSLSSGMSIMILYRLLYMIDVQQIDIIIGSRDRFFSAHSASVTMMTTAPRKSLNQQPMNGAGNMLVINILEQSGDNIIHTYSQY